MQLTMDLILTQHIVSMRMPEGKYVFWLKKKKIGAITFQSSDILPLRHHLMMDPK